MKKVICIIFLLAVIIFIYYMSAQDAFKSNSYNAEVVRILRVKGGIDLYGTFNREYVDIIIRKLGHFFEFSILCIAVYLVLSAFKIRWVTISTSIFCITLAVLDEFHQLYVSGRIPSIIDVAIDSIGIIIALSTISLLRVIKYEFLNREDNYGMKNDRSL